MSSTDGWTEGQAGPELAELLTALAERVPERVEAAAAMATAAYRRAPAAELRRMGEDVTTAAARLAGAFAFMNQRNGQDMALRVYDPDTAADGWEAAGTVVEVSIEDNPFLVSSITEELSRLGYGISDLVHPVMGVERDDQGKVTAIKPARGAERLESFIQVILDRRVDVEEHEPLAEALRKVLSDAQAATRDYAAMRRRVDEIIQDMTATAAARYSEEEIAEAAELLSWLLDDNFVFLGARTYDITREPREVAVVHGSGLGILSDTSGSTYADPVPISEVPDELRERMVGGDLLTVSRTNRRSTVHRQARMIYVGVKRVEPDGLIVGEHRLLGLFAQKAYGVPASTIPVLRRKLSRILDLEDVVDHSYDERALRSLFDAFPKHELFAASTEELHRAIVPLLEASRQSEVRLQWRIDATRRTVSALVSVPRDRFNARLRRRVQDLLTQRFGTETVDYHLSITDSGHALLHFVLHVDVGRLGEVKLEELERDVVALARTWDDSLREALQERFGEDEGRALAERWIGRFPATYQSAVDARDAVEDVVHVTRMIDEDLPTLMALRATRGESPSTHRFLFFKTDSPVELSAFVPILESLGFVVVEEIPNQLEGIGSAGQTRTVFLSDFGVRLVDGGELDVESDGPRMSAAADAVWQGEAEADSLNRLVRLAGLDWRDVAVLRAYRRYARQLGTSFTEAYQNDALIEHREVTRALIDLFAARLAPRETDDPDRLAEAREAVDRALQKVQRLDQDRILRRLRGMIEATVRTNRWTRRRDGVGAKALALKLQSARVPDVPKPVPFVEIFVYSPEVEGIHLRGGPIARGGLRWSDRQEDYRTEVLGLMKAQMVKNAVIVPTGSKGGFVLKRPPADTSQLRDAVREQYQTYIRALLDVTDNVVQGEVVPPPEVFRRDGDDPYLVVAADRGTATFSDVANAISERYGFWLADAFASGGSRGYDHKAMGITARGAWVAVQRHFRELGIDVQTESITMVGIGDMSGDVFGNGLLRSRAVKLVAAFDHRDIFIDPDPDPEVSFEERKRLYDLPGSSWQDYDRSKISAGGGVFSRSAKEIPLTEEMRALLRVDEEVLSPPEVIRAILTAPVDLLFAGGIGTFIKATTESHADVGDRVNDAIRVNADEVGARVIGEGGNLAMTQRGRVQYARRGGRCNADFIDNSAGVDTSDREVNLKILFRAAMDAGRLDDDSRDELLAEMTDDVASAVLRDVYLQTWAISAELASSNVGMEAYEQLMVDLESAESPFTASSRGAANSVRLDREVEVLPSTAEMLERREAGAGLTRPELAVLLGYTKVHLRDALVVSDLPDDPELRPLLVASFPRAAVERFDDLLDSHRLRRELIATALANEIVNRMGITWISRTAHEFAVGVAEVAGAYWAAREVVDAPALWAKIEELDDRCEPELQLELVWEVTRLVDAFARAYLQQGLPSISARIERDRPAMAELAESLEELGSRALLLDRRRRSERYVDLGIPEELAEELTLLSELVITPDVSVLAQQVGRPVRHVADVFFRVNEALPLNYLFERLREFSPRGRWERWQHRGLLDDLRAARGTAAARILREYPDLAADKAVAEFLSARVAAQERVHAMIELLQREDEAPLSALSVTVRMLRDAVASIAEDEA